MTETHKPRVALFVTCLVDLFRPEVGFAAVSLIEESGCTVEAPASQTCCGQPAYNSGDKGLARSLAMNTVATLEGYDYVVAPSGSCAGMIKDHFARLLDSDPAWRARAQRVADKTHELVSFLVDVRKMERTKATFDGSVAYHDSCSGLRELGVHRQPRALLRQTAGLTLRNLPDADVCCGFGGTFCVKYPEISDKIVAKKADAVGRSGADTLLAGDLGCLMNIAGKLKRQGSNVKVRHVAEVLAGMTDGPAIGEER